MSWKLYEGDCLEVMSTFPSDSFDIVFTSPPYNLGNNHHTGNKKHNPYNDNLDESDYQISQISILNEIYRVLKKNGSLIYNHKNRIKKGIQITPYEWLLKTDFVIKQELVWFNGSPNFDKIRFYPMTERIYWLTKSPKTKLINNINHHDLFTKKDWKPEGTSKKHTRAFPLKLVEDILKCFPNSFKVLDPFAGSGTVGIASHNLNKNCVLIEQKPEYCQIIRDRLSELNLEEYQPEQTHKLLTAF